MSNPSTAAAETTAARSRVSIDAEAWKAIDHALAELPYRISAPLVNALAQTGGVHAIAAPKEDHG